MFTVLVRLCDEEIFFLTLWKSLKERSIFNINISGYTTNSNNNIIYFLFFNNVPAHISLALTQWNWECTCDVCLSAFDSQQCSLSLLWLGSPQSSSGPKLQIFLCGLCWRRTSAGSSSNSCFHHLLCHAGPDHTAMVERWHVLAPQLFPLNAPGDRLVPLKVKVPALFGVLHAHAEEPLEVLLQLLVVHRAKEVPPNYCWFYVVLLPVQQPKITCSWCHGHVPVKHGQRREMPTLEYICLVLPAQHFYIIFAECIWIQWHFGDCMKSVILVHTFVCVMQRHSDILSVKLLFALTAYMGKW